MITAVIYDTPSESHAGRRVKSGKRAFQLSAVREFAYLYPQSHTKHLIF